jgi:hypothetical protein
MTFIYNCDSQAVEQNRAVMNRLIQSEQITINHPEIQQYLSKNALKTEDFFRKEEILEEKLFYQAKAYVYAQLNLFDSILCVPSQKNEYGIIVKLKSFFKKTAHFN